MDDVTVVVRTDLLVAMREGGCRYVVIRDLLLNARLGPGPAGQLEGDICVTTDCTSGAPSKCTSRNRR